MNEQIPGKKKIFNPVEKMESGSQNRIEMEIDSRAGKEHKACDGNGILVSLFSVELEWFYSISHSGQSFRC